MRATRFEKPNARTGEEYGLYLSFEDRRELIDAATHMIEQVKMEGLQGYDEPHIKALERMIEELKYPS